MGWSRAAFPPETAAGDGERFCELEGYVMSDSGIDWKRHDELYLYNTFAQFPPFERPESEPEHRSPMQRVMRQIKSLRGERYHYHLHPGGWVNHDLPHFMHESWFQLPAAQKEEWLLRHVDWSGVSEKTRDQLIAWQLRSRDGEINARDEWHLHDQLMRVEATTPSWSELSSTAKLETLLRSKEVDWRPFPPEFQAIALGHMIRRQVRPTKEGFEVVGVFEAKGDYPHFGRYGPSKDRDAFEQRKRKGPRRPMFSKAYAREQFRWAVAKPWWEASLKEHGQQAGAVRWEELRREFRERMRPLWQEFWAAAKTLSRDDLNKLACDRHSQTRDALKATAGWGGERRVGDQPHRSQGLASPSEIAKERGEDDPAAGAGPERGNGYSPDRSRGR
jgi:hypothetical protein